MRLKNYEISLEIVSQMLDLYNQTGDLNNVDVFKYPKGFESFTELMLQTVGYGDIKTKEINNDNIEKVTLPFDNDKRVLVGFSSGFDSTYHALKLKSDGYIPVLFHIKSLNKSYPDEFNKSNDFADMYKFDIVNVEIDDNINNVFIDNPMKNQLVLSLMIDYGFSNGINKFALGNNINENIDECRVQYGISDSIQMFVGYREGIKNYIDNLKFFDIKETKSEAYNFVGRNYPQALETVNSCITPHRFKKHLNKLNSKKFDIEPLSDTRCMSCYKCAIEAILLDYNGIVDYSSEYLQHGYNIIRKKSDTIFTTKIATKKSTNEKILKGLLEC